MTFIHQACACDSKADKKRDTARFGNVSDRRVQHNVVELIGTVNLRHIKRGQVGKVTTESYSFQAVVSAMREKLVDNSTSLHCSGEVDILIEEIRWLLKRDIDGIDCKWITVVLRQRDCLIH